MNIYKRIFAYVPDSKALAGVSILLSLLSAFAVASGYYLIYEFFNYVIVLADANNLWQRAIVICVVMTISWLLYIASGTLSHKVAFRIETNLKKKGIEGITNASFRFFDTHTSGFVRKTIDDNTAKTHAAVAHMLPDNTRAFSMPILCLGLAFAINLKVGLVLLLLAIASAFVMSLMMGNKGFMKSYQDALGKLASETVEYIRGMQVIKVFGNQVQSFESLNKAIDDYSKYVYRYSISCQKSYVIYQLIFFGIVPILTIPTCLFASKLGAGREIALSLIMIFFMSGILFVTFMNVMWASKNIYDATYCLDNLEKLYNEMQEDKLSYGDMTTFPNCNIEFDNVSFSYGDKEVLSGFSLSLQEKKIYALVGSSGSGKSTIAKLLSGFYKVDSGAIKIGGFPLENYTKECITSNIAFVFQNPNLFKKSIYENIALARPGASREDVMGVIKLSGCLEIIDRFPERENTMIGSKGVYLSGGEKQRIAIARALLKDAPIVVFDEASASIDADSEYKLLTAFRSLMKGRTVILIAHRLSTIKSVDEILVVEGGQIAERGTHNELEEQNGIYSRLRELYDSTSDWRVSNEELA